MNISVRQIKIICVFIIALLSIYLIWGKLTRPYGVQKVNFTPSKSETFAKGKLNFSVYRANTGVLYPTKKLGDKKT